MGLIVGLFFFFAGMILLLFIPGIETVPEIGLGLAMTGVIVDLFRKEAKKLPRVNFLLLCTMAMLGLLNQKEEITWLTIILSLIWILINANRARKKKQKK